MLEYSKYKRGSEWRNWDLHFHTPSSHDYENKVSLIRDYRWFINNISVVAITDHHVLMLKGLEIYKPLAVMR